MQMHCQSDGGDPAFRAKLNALPQVRQYAPFELYALWKQ